VTIDQETARDVRAVDPPGVAGLVAVDESLLWPELDQWGDYVAALLLDRLAPGQRVAILAGPGLEYAASFLGALRAGMIAVPLCTPGPRGHAGRLRAALADCRPALVLTTRADLVPVCQLVSPYQAVVVIEDIPAGTIPRRPVPDPGSVAYLRYTYSSTHAPIGVPVTHADVVANSAVRTALVGELARTATGSRSW
jgi:acyl-CoA synthetase (AMP-forming)/AMP-acid ligase II